MSTALNLADAQLYYGTTYDPTLNRIGDAVNTSDFSFPEIVISAGSTTTVELDFYVDPAGHSWNFSLLSMNAAGNPDTSSQYELHYQTLTPGTQTISVTLQPGVDQFDAAITAGETRVLVDMFAWCYVTGIRYSDGSTPPPPDPRTGGAETLRGIVSADFTGAASYNLAIPTCQVGDLIVLMAGSDQPLQTGLMDDSWQVVGTATSSGTNVQVACTTAAAHHVGGTLRVDFYDITDARVVLAVAPNVSGVTPQAALIASGGASSAASTTDKSITAEVGIGDQYLTFFAAKNPSAAAASTLGALAESGASAAWRSSTWVGQYGAHATLTQDLTVPSNSGYGYITCALWVPKYGDWIQPPNDTLSTSGSNSIPSGVVVVAGGHVHVDGTSTIDGSKLNDAATASVGGWSTSYADVDLHISGTLGPLSAVGNSAGPPPYVDYTAKRDYRLRYAYVTNYSQSVTLPAGAVNYQLGSGGTEWQVVGANMDLDLTSVNRNTATGGSVTGSWTTELRGVTDVTFSAPASDYTRQPTGWGHGLGGAVAGVSVDTGTDGTITSFTGLDVSSFLYGGPRDGFLAFIVNLTGLPDPVNGLTDETGWTIGANPGVPTVRYAIKPNRVRYGYRYEAPAAVVTIAPPLRQWPRSDALGASSARRLWPLSPSVQASNRRVGGYL